MPTNHMILEAIGGFGVFFIGLRFYLGSLQGLFGQTLSKILQSVTHQRISSFMVGIASGVFIQSGSVTASTSASLANAGLMGFIQAVAFQLGALLGASAAIWWIGLNDLVNGLGLIAASLLVLLFVRTERVIELARLFISIGFVFLGVNFLITHLPVWPKILFLQNPFDILGINFIVWVLAGMLSAFLLQSMMSVLVLAAVFLHISWLNEFAVLSVVAGAVLGPSFNVAFSRKGKSVKAKRVVLGFLMSGILGLSFSFVAKDFFWTPFFISLTGLNAGFKVAAIYFVLCWINSILALPLLGFAARFSEKIIKDREFKEPQRLSVLGELSPSLAIGQGIQETQKLAAMIHSMLSLSLQYTRTNSEKEEMAKRILKYEKITDNIQDEMDVFFEIVMRSRLMAWQSRSVRALLAVVSELENIADSCQDIIQFLEKIRTSAGTFGDLPKESENRIRACLGESIELFEELLTHVTDESAKGFIEKQEIFEQRWESVADGNERIPQVEERLISIVCEVKDSTRTIFEYSDRLQLSGQN